MNGAEFNQLNAFVAVAARQNFARAASDLGIGPSAISQTIRSLERRLGVRLFNRTTRSVSLTDAGERLLLRIRPAIMEMDSAIDDLDEFRNEPTGTLRLNVSDVAAQIILAPVIKEFLKAYPMISLDIQVDNGQGDIAAGRFDAGIRVGRRVAKDMQIVRISQPSRLIAIASPEYLDRHNAPQTPNDLQDHNCIRLRSNEAIMTWEFAKGRRKVEISVNGSLIVNSAILTVRAALDGIGIAYTIESYVTSEIARGRLIPLLTDWSPAHQSYYLYYSGQRQLPLPLRTFIDFLKQRQRHP